MFHVAQFFTSETAQAMYEDHVRFIVTRRSSVDGGLYADDPTIMAWEVRE